ncbi:hypothetical protein [Flavobacterium rhizosphaerae]|uniref:Immunodominant membrane protein n=1 Tax=Flavobacterium rhizosphaerae TaxID=3163298 RepID=A0ABW8YTF1_9FLAO
MAEIKIEKKKPVWPWILLVLVIAAIVYFIFFRDDKNNDQEVQQTTVVSDNDYTNDADNISNNIEIATYVNFISENRNEMGLDHEFTNEAFMKLIAATQSAADAIDYDITNDMGQVKQYAEKITNDPYETSHADNIKKAAETLSVTLKNIQEKANSEFDSEGTAVKDAAASIDSQKLTLDQKSEVKSFFDKAADLLEKINQ